MKLYFDLDQATPAAQYAAGRELQRVVLLKRFSSVELEVHFHRDRVLQQLPDGTLITATLKTKDYDSTPLAQATEFTFDETDKSYSCTLDLDTVEMDAAFDGRTSLPTFLQIDFGEASTATINCTVADSVSRPDDGSPISSTGAPDGAFAYYSQGWQYLEAPVSNGEYVLSLADGEWSWVPYVAVDTSELEQDVADLEAGQVAQGLRLDGHDLDIADAEASIAAIEAAQVVQDSRLTALETSGGGGGGEGAAYPTLLRRTPYFKCWFGDSGAQAYATVQPIFEERSGDRPTEWNGSNAVAAGGLMPRSYYYSSGAPFSFQSALASDPYLRWCQGAFTMAFRVRQHPDDDLYINWGAFSSSSGHGLLIRRYTLSDSTLYRLNVYHNGSSDFTTASLASLSVHARGPADDWATYFLTSSGIGGTLTLWIVWDGQVSQVMTLPLSQAMGYPSSGERILTVGGYTSGGTVGVANNNYVDFGYINTVVLDEASMLELHERGPM